MKTYFYSSILLILLTTASCNITRHTASKDDGLITATFVQVNDVFEIAPLAGALKEEWQECRQSKKNLFKKSHNFLL